MNYSSRNNSRTVLLLMPWLLTFAIFWLYPLLYAAYLSMTDYYALTGRADFIGLDNYSRLFQDAIFWKAFTNTSIFVVVTVPLTTFFSLFLATAINDKATRFKNFFRVSFFMPSVASMVVIALIFTNLYGQGGYINSLLQMIGLPYPERGWLQEPSTALISIMAMDVWIATGYYTILFLAGMQSIPEDLYEYARLAGASPWQRFWRITLPMLKPTLLFVVVINTIKSFQVFVEVFVMTKGGPMNETMTMVYLVFENAFMRTNMMGYAAAIAFVLFIILIFLSIVQIKLLKVR